MRKKEKKCAKIVLVVRSKLTTAKKIQYLKPLQVLKEFTTIMNEAGNYCKLN